MHAYPTYHCRIENRVLRRDTTDTKTMDNLFGGGGGGGGGPAQFLRDLPPITRILLVSTLLCTALVNLDFLKREDLDFRGWEDVFGRGRSGRVEAWRYVVGVVAISRLISIAVGKVVCTMEQTSNETTI